MRPNIWVLCHPHLASSATVIGMSDQFIAIRTCDSVLVFVHAKNQGCPHRTLWLDLLKITDDIMCIMGDFNVVLGAHERSTGVLTQSAPTEEFRDFISAKDLYDIDVVGSRFTWSTRRNGGFTAARLDRALASQGFLQLWVDVELLVLPMVYSDHHPLRLRTTWASPRLLGPSDFKICGLCMIVSSL